MKVIRIVVSVWLLIGVAALCSESANPRSPVVVELFTSEGCSSCPPADALVADLSKKGGVNGAEVLVLGEHVDYWNHSGWTDRFSSATFTHRQQAYAKRFHLASPYTPEIVIDGRYETLGSDANSVQHAIDLAAGVSKAATVKLTWLDKNKLEISIQGAGDERCAVLLSVTEDNLETSVRGGENGGRILRHSGVVRELHAVGRTSGGIYSGNAVVQAPEAWKRENLRIIVLVQRPGTGEIIGAAAIRFS